MKDAFLNTNTNKPFEEISAETRPISPFGESSLFSRDLKKEQIERDDARLQLIEKNFAIVSIEGPYNSSGERVQYISKEHAYHYFVIANQTLDEDNIKNIKWAVSFDDDTIDKAFYLFSAGTIEGKKLKVNIQISKPNEKFKIYAYTKNIQNNTVFVEVFYRKVVLFFIGGAGDKTTYVGQGPSKIVENKVRYPFMKSYKNNKQYLSEYLSYDEIFGEIAIQKNVVPVIPNKNGTSVYIIGHSLGGWNGAHLSKGFLIRDIKLRF